MNIFQIVFTSSVPGFVLEHFSRLANVGSLFCSDRFLYCYLGESGVNGLTVKALRKVKLKSLIAYSTELLSSAQQ